MASSKRDPLVLASVLNNVGILHSRQGDYDKALENLRGALEVLITSFSRDDIFDGDNKNHTQQVSDEISRLQQVHTILTNKTKQAVIKSRDTPFSMVEPYDREGQAERRSGLEHIEINIQDVQEERTSLPETDDIYSSIIMVNTAIVHEKTGSDSKAFGIYELAFAMLRDKTNNEHQDDLYIQATALKRMGQIELLGNELAESLKLSTKAFEAADQYLRHALPLTEPQQWKICSEVCVSSLSAMSQASYLSGNHSMAMEMSLKLQGILEMTPDSKDKGQHASYDTSALLYNRGLIYCMTDDFKNALEMFQHVAEKTRGEDLNAFTSLRAMSIHQAGVVYLRQKHFNEAMQAFTEALSLRRAIHGAVHRDVAETMSMIGCVMQDQQDYSNALRIYNSVLLMQRQLFGQTDLRVAETNYKIGQIHLCQGCHDDALSFFRAVAAVLKMRPGNEAFLHDTLCNIAGIRFDQGNRAACMAVHTELVSLGLECLPTNIHEWLFGILGCFGVAPAAAA